MPDIIENENWIGVYDRRVSYQIIYSREKQPENEVRMVVIVVDPEGPGTLRVTQEILDIETAGVLRATEAVL